MENKEYKICNSCIMDTSDPNIYFNDKGICNYCLNFKELQKKLGFSKEEFQNIFNGENKTYKKYSNKRNIIHLGAKTLIFFGLEKRYF